MSADAHARAPRRGTTALALTAGGAAVILVTLLVSGVTVAEVCLYGAFEALYAVLPGLVLNRARSQRSAPAADTLAVSVPLGLAAQTGAFVLGAALGAPWLLLGLPLPFLAAVAVRLSRGRGGRGRGGRRGRWRALALARVAGGEATVLALVVLGATLIVYVALFAPSPLPRDVDSVSYYPDLVFNVSLAAELLHHWPFTSPSVSGLALHYHVFANIDMAAAAQVTRLNLASIAMRLQPSALICLVALQLFALGRRVGGSGAAGLASLAICMLGGELDLSRGSFAGGGVPVLSGLYSPSYQLGAVFFLAILIVLVEPDARAPGAWLR